jgi:hypothetical protein
VALVAEHAEGAVDDVILNVGDDFEAFTTGKGAVDKLKIALNLRPGRRREAAISLTGMGFSLFSGQPFPSTINYRARKVSEKKH